MRQAPRWIVAFLLGLLLGSGASVYAQLPGMPHEIIQIMRDISYSLREIARKMPD